MKTKITLSMIACVVSSFSLNVFAENTPSQTTNPETQYTVMQKNYTGKEIRYFGPVIIKNENIQDQKILSYGTVRLENCTFKKEVTCFGSLTASSCMFYDNVEVSGSLKATQSSFNDDVKVTGGVSLDDCDCKKMLSIRGELQATKSTLNDLTISTAEFRLDNSTVNNIRITQAGSGLTDQNLYLNNSTIKGDISFESGKGKIYLKGNAKITGKVKGTVITKEQSPTLLKK